MEQPSTPTGALFSLYSTPDQDAFYYGRRQVITYNKTAQPSYSYTPLTQADFLNPQPGDEFAHGPRHAADLRYLNGVFRYHYRGNPVVAVYSGIKMIWDVTGIAQPAPDVAIVIGAEGGESNLKEFDVQAMGQRPRFVLEIVAPRFVEADLVEKLPIYAQAGVQEYFIVDSRERMGKPVVDYTVVGYRLVKGTYQPIVPESDGRVYSKVNRLWLLPNAANDGVTAISERTGQIIVPDADSLTSAVAARAEAAFRATAIASQLDL
jgi:hypothetical protein